MSSPVVRPVVVASLLVVGCAEPPAPMELSFSEGFIPGCRGHQIAYQQWLSAEDARGTLILSTGRTEYSDKYHHLLPLLDPDLDVIFFDHLGQGRSDGLRAHVSSVDEEYACDMQQVITTLAAPDRPRYLLSHSMGGLAAIRAIQMDPGLVDAAVFSAPMWGLKLPEGTSAASARAVAEAMVDSGRAEEPMVADDGDISDCDEAKLTHDCDLYDQFKDDPLTHIGAPTWGAGVAFLDGIDRMHAALDAVPVPIHVLTAGDDHYVDVPTQATVCDGINRHGAGPCTQSRYDDDWHELLNEVSRATYLGEALDFFSQR